MRDDLSRHQREVFRQNFLRLLSGMGKTQADVAAALGITASTVSDWATGKKYPRPERIAALAACLGVSPGALREEKPSGTVIPVLGSVPAGIPIEAITDILDWEEIPAAMLTGGREYFALQVRGDSMAPRYEPGDVLIVRRQEDCVGGQDCIVMVNGSDATFKRVLKEDASLTLKPLNPAYGALSFTWEQVQTLPVRVIGVVAELRRRV